MGTNKYQNTNNFNIIPIEQSGAWIYLVNGYEEAMKQEVQEDLSLYWQAEGHQIIIYANIQLNMSGNFW